jgi:DNA-binding NarL/FixJ family response regulator
MFSGGNGVGLVPSKRLPSKVVEGCAMPVRIVIADDHEVVRQGLHTILRARPEWQIVGEAENGRQAVDCVRELHPDVLILDITMPLMSGLEAAQELLKKDPGTRILIFTMHDSKSLIQAVRKAGAQGYVLKSRAAKDLIHAIEALLDGKTFFGPDTATGEEVKDKGRGGTPLLRQAVHKAYSWLTVARRHSVHPVRRGDLRLGGAH